MSLVLEPRLRKHLVERDTILSHGIWGRVLIPFPSTTFPASSQVKIYYLVEGRKERAKRCHEVGTLNTVDKKSNNCTDWRCPYEITALTGFAKLSWRAPWCSVGWKQHAQIFKLTTGQFSRKHLQLTTALLLCTDLILLIVSRCCPHSTFIVCIDVFHY